MNRRDFSAAAGRRRPRRPAGRRRRRQAQARRWKARTTSRWQHAGAGAAGRQDRGGRVLLVRLPALQRVRAGARGLGQEAAGRRGRSAACRSASATMHVPHAARSIYALEALGKVDAMHRKVFAAIHVRAQRLRQGGRHRRLRRRRTASTPPSSSTAYKSFAVATKARQARQLAEAYKIDGVPALGVARPLLHRRPSLAGSADAARCCRRRLR